MYLLQSIYCPLLPPACRHSSKAGIVDVYEGHQAPVTGVSTHSTPGQIDFSHLFLTSSIDWTIKLWSMKVGTTFWSFFFSSFFLFFLSFFQDSLFLLFFLVFSFFSFLSFLSCLFFLSFFLVKYQNLISQQSLFISSNWSFYAVTICWSLRFSCWFLRPFFYLYIILFAPCNM